MLSERLDICSFRTTTSGTCAEASCYFDGEDFYHWGKVHALRLFRVFHYLLDFMAVGAPLSERIQKKDVGVLLLLILNTGLGCLH